MVYLKGRILIKEAHCFLFVREDIVDLKAQISKEGIKTGNLPSLLFIDSKYVLRGCGMPATGILNLF